MKRILTLLIILFSVADMFAQRDLTEHRPVWFGVNMGGTWQTSDMKPVAGIGWGFTVARYSRISNPSPIYWGWRLRFLDGRNFGYNYHALQGIKNNLVLSSYYSNTDPDTGFVYSNYKMRLDEFAGEIVIGSNTLRKHGVLLYGWGGAGMTYWKTNTDLLDASGNVYNYSTITDNGNADLVNEQLDLMWDRNYETNANGSVNGAQWGFMPSAGIGFGYQWSNFSIVMEHKTTWALNDLIDGTNHSSAGTGTSHLNDIYHYDGLSLRWNFHTPRPTTYTNDPLPQAPNPTGYNPPQNQPQTQPIPVDPTPQPQPTPNIPGLQPPTVTFTTPSVDPYTATTPNQNLVVRVTNVAQSSQISLQINNQVNSNFSFNPVTSTMTFSHTLQPGTNTYKVIATNSVGSAQDVQTIVFKGQNDPTPTGPPPAVTITAPSTDPYTSTTQSYTVKATVLNVDNASAITVKKDGNAITNFSYDVRSKVVTFTSTLSNGNNSFIVTGTNQYGTASDAVTIVYGNNTPTIQPPVVTITTPASCPMQTKVQNHTITANVTNVTMASQVSVVFNNQTVSNFTFTVRGANATVSFPVVLQSGTNNFTITGTNAAGSDAESCVITYKPNVQAVVPPDVEITVPSADPFTSTTAAFTLKATVLNVGSASEITMTVNNGVITGWTYDMNSKVLTYSTTLVAGATNVYVITATNANGTDSDRQSVTYNTVPVDPNPSGGSSRPGETTVVPGGSVGNTSPAGGSSRPGETTVVPGGSVGNTSPAGGSSRPGETTVTPGGNVSGDPGQASGGDRPKGPAPTIDLHVPSSSPVSTGTTTFPVTMIVHGVASQNEITVRVNSVVKTSGITYNAGSGTLSFTVTLVNGQNSIQVKAQNGNGTATRTLIVNCNATSNRTQQQNDPKSPEPEKSEPKKDEPKKDEPKQSAPVKSEPKKDEPKKEDPKPAPVKSEPKKEEPKKEEPTPAPGGNRGGSSSPAPAGGGSSRPR
jgi:hypothetical protein